MLQRMSDSGLAAIRRAEQEARRAGHREIALEHLLLGALETPSVRAIVSDLVDIDRVRGRVAPAQDGAMEEDVSERPFDSAALAALTRAGTVVEDPATIGAADVLKACLDQWDLPRPGADEIDAPRLAAALDDVGADAEKGTAPSRSRYAGGRRTPAESAHAHIAGGRSARSVALPSAQALADAVGTVIHVPRAWPPAWDAPTYVARTYPEDDDAGCYEVRWGSGRTVRVLTGRTTPSTSPSSGGEWLPVPELDDLGGMEKNSGYGPHLVVHPGHHRVDLLGFSRADAVSVALGLLPVHPA